MNVAKSTNKDNKSVSYNVPALEKSLDIIDYLVKCNEDLTTHEISTRLHIPIATTYRIVQYLFLRGYLKESQGKQGAFLLGNKFLHVAESVKNRLNINMEALPAMRQLANTTGQTVNFGVLQDYGVMYILQELPALPVNIIAGLRVILSVNTSAIGKVLTAYLPDSERDLFLQKTTLTKKTEKSITGKTAFSKELQKVKKQGFATDEEEFALGISCMAAPVFDYKGVVVASVGVTGHTRDYIDASSFNNIKEAVLRTAANISAAYGFEPGNS
jgi:DNA-binding IclR family transcriptional regulator